MCSWSVRLAVSGLILSALPGCGEGPARRPSVILISLDTLRADHMGVYGYERDTTPHLDLLAEESLVFDRAFAPSAWTLISHMTMLTGLYPNQHGVVKSDRALAHQTPLLAERLHALGYQTVGLYYEGWIHARHGFDRGFDVFRSHEDAAEAGRHLEEAMAGLDPGRPFFLFLHLFDIHCGPLGNSPGPIYHAPPPYDEMFLPGAAARMPDVPERKVWLTRGLLDEAQVEALVALYDGGIRHVDDVLGGWIDGWKRAGILDDALLVVTADHGEALCQRGTIRDHGGCYQEGLHVPLIVRHPDGLRAGERELGTAHLADVVPTILDFVGDRRGAALPGVSLLRSVPADRVVYASNPANYEVFFRWPEKLVRAVRKDFLIRLDLDADPLELDPKPLEQTELDAMRELFLRSGGSADGYAPAIEAEAPDPAQLEELSAMGYTGEDR